MHFFDSIACNVWRASIFFPHYYVYLSEGFLLFPCLNSFLWQQTLQTPQRFLCAKWISVKRLRWNLSTPGDQIDPAAARDETDDSSKLGRAKARSLLRSHGRWKGANNFILPPELRGAPCFHYLWTSMALGCNSSCWNHFIILMRFFLFPLTMIKSTGEKNFSSLFLKLKKNEGSGIEMQRKPAKQRQPCPLLLISPSASAKTKEMWRPGFVGTWSSKATWLLGPRYVKKADFISIFSKAVNPEYLRAHLLKERIHVSKLTLKLNDLSALQIR